MVCTRILIFFKKLSLSSFSWFGLNFQLLSEGIRMLMASLLGLIYSEKGHSSTKVQNIKYSIKT